MHSVQLRHGPVRRVRPTRLAGFSLLLLFLQTSAAWSRPEIVVPLAFGNEYKLDLVKNGDDKNDHAAAVKGSIRVCGGHEYEFRYTATPAPGWDVVEPEFDNKINIWTKTVSLSPEEPEGKVKIGTVRFRNLKGEEADVKADVVVTVYSFLLNDGGSAEKRFTASIDQQLIEDKLNRMFGKRLKINKSVLLQSIETAIQAIVAKTPNLGINLKAEAKKLLHEAENYIATKIDAYNSEVNTGVNEAAGTLKSAVDNATPKITFSGNYKFRCGFRDPGAPGWTLNPLEIGGDGMSISGHGNINLVIPISLSVEAIAGGRITINAELHATVSAKGTFLALSPVDPSPVDRPVAKAGATPAVNVELSGSAGGGFALTVDVGVAKTSQFKLPAVNAELEAGQTKTDP